MRNTCLLWNEEWEFGKFPLGTTCNEVMDAELLLVEIPHDWLIYDTNDLYQNGEGWYRKHFNVNAEKIKGRILINFGAVYMDLTIFVNEKKVMDWKYGYSTFECDITDFVHEGDNVILVRARKMDEKTWEVRYSVETYNATGKDINEYVMLVETPQLWDIENPVLYRMSVTFVNESDNVYHECSFNIGFKKTEVSLVKEHDYDGNGKITIGSNYMPWENAPKWLILLNMQDIIMQKNIMRSITRSIRIG